MDAAGSGMNIPFPKSPEISSGESVRISINIRNKGEHAVDGDFVLVVPNISVTFESQPLVLGPS